VASDCTGPRRSRCIDCHRCQMLGHTSYVSFSRVESLSFHMIT
jgi:hypothetical protein